MSDTNTESLLREVKELIGKVNAILPEDKKVSLEPEKKIKTVNLFVCEYKDEFNTGIEFFKKIGATSAEYCCRDDYLIPFRDKCYIYESVSSDKKAILYTCKGIDRQYGWVKIGDSFKYEPWKNRGYEIVANCELNNIISYNDIRTSMLSDGVINNFNLNYTTEEEITKVLAYLHNNYLKKENRYPRRLEKNS